ncbi:MAG: Flp family type IVb pilin [Planctomycetota bacterium]|jgi:Flp pilus assembly pilin Flp
MKALRRFLRDESGLETVEWAFVLGFVVLVAVLAFMGARDSLTTIFSEMNTELADAATFGGS